MPQNWTYTTAKFETTGLTRTKFDEEAFDTKLNEYGRQGWELVSVFDTNAGDGGTRFVLAVFKRPA
jgi:hypothetical protein